MSKGGRKGYGEELRIKQRFSALTEPYFKVLNEFLESEDKADRKFAVSELTKAYARMIPTEITGEDGEAIKFVIEKINYIVPNGDNSTPNTETAPSVSSTE